ncbi:MAG: peptidase M28, partial [Desulfobacterales bacterium CG07_land_8_20_14_0_80_52_14]
MKDVPQHSPARLKAHVETLTKTIGERSVSVPDNLDRTAAYLQSCFEEIGIPVHMEAYQYGGLTVSNVVA